MNAKIFAAAALSSLLLACGGGDETSTQGSPQGVGAEASPQVWSCSRIRKESSSCDTYHSGIDTTETCTESIYPEHCVSKNNSGVFGPCIIYDNTSADLSSLPCATMKSIGYVGARCQTDADCGSLICLRNDGADWFGTGFPGGLCTTPCGSDAHQECGTWAKCEGWEGSDKAYCIPSGCTDTAQVRSQYRCVALPDGFQTVTIPGCTSSAECAPGASCDPETGGCRF
jgi:hypothetical protein